MAVLAALHRIRREVCFLDRTASHHILAVPDLVTAGIQADHIPFGKIYESIGHSKQGEDIRCQVMLLKAQPQHHRAAFTGTHYYP